MGKFCTQCGRPLQEGEICNCMQQNSMINQGVNQQQGYNNQNVGYQQQMYQQNFAKKRGVPRLLVPISQIVTGGILVIEGLYTMEWAWGDIAFITAAGFLITGICGLISSKK